MNKETDGTSPLHAPVTEPRTNSPDMELCRRRVVSAAHRLGTALSQHAFDILLDRLMAVSVEHGRLGSGTPPSSAERSVSTRRSAAQKESSHSDATSHIGASGDSRQENK